MFGYTKEAGIKIIKNKNVYEVIKADKVIKTDKKHRIYLFDFVENFDYFFSIVVGQRLGIDVYSRVRREEVSWRIRGRSGFDVSLLDGRAVEHTLVHPRYATAYDDLGQR